MVPIIEISASLEVVAVPGARGCLAQTPIELVLIIRHQCHHHQSVAVNKLQNGMLVNGIAIIDQHSRKQQ